MNFKKEILDPFRKLLVAFRTIKDCHSCRSLLLAEQICSLNWDLDMDSFVGTLCIRFDGPVARYLLVMQGDLSSNPRCFFQDGILLSLGSNLVFIIPWDYFVPDRIPRMTLELYK
jgi:hypothetical protein